MEGRAPETKRSTIKVGRVAHACQAPPAFATIACEISRNNYLSRTVRRRRAPADSAHGRNLIHGK